MLAVAIVKGANAYLDLVATNQAHAEEISQLEADKEALAIKEAQHLALISTVEDNQAEKVRLATPISERLSLPKVAVVTMYACSGLDTEDKIMMNCPSIKKHPAGKTATGATPVPYLTAACSKNNLGKKFKVGDFVVDCNDRGGAISEDNRFDLFGPDYQTAIQWGVRYLPFTEIK